MSGGEDFTPEELHALSLMGRARKSLPEGEFWGVAALQNLAGIYARYRHAMTEEDQAILIGVGACLRYFSESEMKAQVQAMMAISKARRPHRKE